MALVAVFSTVFVELHSWEESSASDLDRPD
jgi:hypothetical protein